MVALIQKHNDLTRQLADIQAQISQLEASPQFAIEKEFHEKLTLLMTEHGKTVGDVIRILDPQASSKSVTSVKPQRTRTVVTSVYKHPETGEEVIYRGGNNLKLKAWRLQYGQDTVESWKQP